MSISNTTLILACLFAGIAECEAPQMPWNHADDAPCVESRGRVCDEPGAPDSSPEVSL